eukprot:TRINITY_DN1584_c0_g1_i7.p1 TRINITY_DN1584_c0_g1~~TRINITY_DN1584_c0_g1_i7.p1  ORF type:complete len:233 (-),score=50.60 TRINITY_DN1584_c0_g1_i7:764-1462(-)
MILFSFMDSLCTDFIGRSGVVNSMMDICNNSNLIGLDPILRGTIQVTLNKDHGLRTADAHGFALPTTLNTPPNVAYVIYLFLKLCDEMRKQRPEWERRSVSTFYQNLAFVEVSEEVWEDSVHVIKSNLEAIPPSSPLELGPKEKALIDMRSYLFPTAWGLYKMKKGYLSLQLCFTLLEMLIRNLHQQIEPALDTTSKVPSIADILEEGVLSCRLPLGLLSRLRSPTSSGGSF